MDTDKREKIHVDIYDRAPEDKKHLSIHINIDTKTVTGQIVEKEPGKENVPTDTQCYLTSACMSHYLTNFDDDYLETIENGDYDFAYNRYKESILSLEQTYLKSTLEYKLVRTLKKQII